MSRIFLIAFLAAAFLAAPSAFGPAAPLGLSGSAQAADELHVNGQPHPSPKEHARTGGGNAYHGAATTRGGGGGGRGGGGGGRAGGGGGRRSDIALKHDITLLGHLDNGLGFYRFSYNGSNKVYVGVMAQEVQAVMPEAVARDNDGYLRVYYDTLGLKFQTYDQWVASGAQVPAGAAVRH